MKRKIALLLAGIMALATLPMNVFAASANSLSRTAVTITEEAVFVPEGYDIVDEGDDRSKEVSPYIKLELKDGLEKGESFTIDIINGEWAFDDGDYVKNPSATMLDKLSYIGKETDPATAGGTTYTATAKPDAVLTLANSDATYLDKAAVVTAIADAAGTADTGKDATAFSGVMNAVPVTGDIATYVAALVTAAKTAITTGEETAVGGAIDTAAAAFAPETDSTAITVTDTTPVNYAKAATDVVNAFKTANPTYMTDGVTAPADATDDTVTTSSTPVAGANTFVDLGFTAELSNTDDSRIIVTNVSSDNARKKDFMFIPVVAFTDETENDVQVRINGSSTISASTLTFASPVQAKLTATVSGADKDRYESVFDVSVKENTRNTLKNGDTYTFELSKGATFDRVLGKSASDLTKANKVDIYGGTSTATLTDLKDVIGFDVYVPTLVQAQISSEGKKLQVYVEYKTPVNNSTVGGFALKDVKVDMPDNDRFGDITMNVSAKDADLDVTGLVVGSYSDWNVGITAVTEPTTLLSGKFDAELLDADKDQVDPDNMDDVTLDEIGDISDKSHKTAEIKFTENTTGSWLSSTRETEFILPADVKILSAKISDTKNMTNINNTYNFVDNKKYGTDKVRIEDNILYIKNIEVKDGEKAEFKISFDVAAEASFEGDVTVKLGGKAVDYEGADTEVKIATFETPIKVDTKVSDVKIGYQSYSVSDITLQETEKGRFQADEKVNLSLKLEGVNSSALKFYDATAKVTEGDLVFEDNKKVDDEIEVDDGIIYFYIAEESKSTEPSTIVISDVEVVLDRTVPETNKKPVRVKVTTSQGRATSVGDDTIRYGSIQKDYINVITAASGSSNLYTTVVGVTEGSTECTANKEVVTMDTAPFIDPATNSLMVPMSFVSDALGLTIGKDLIWDADKKSVTIFADSSTIQFVVGQNTYTKNGAVITNEHGAITQIVDDRTFVPFRTLGNALGVETRWDAETRTAYYNDGTDAK